MIPRVLLLSLCLVAPSQAQQVVVVLLDDSGSMNNVMRSQRNLRKIDAAKRALLTVLEQVPPDAHVGVLVFNGATDREHWIIPLGQVDESSLKQAVQEIGAGGGTPLGTFMKHAADELLSRRTTMGYGDYRLLIVTDGEANDALLVERYLPDIMRRAITVDVIGVDMAQDHSLATQVDNYRRADDPESLTRAIQQSLAESSADQNDPDEESDFELLAGLPDEVALAAIETLSKMDNSAIGETKDDAAWQDETVYHRSGSPSRTNRQNTPGSQEPQRQGGWVGSVLVGIALILAILFGTALKGLRR